MLLVLSNIRELDGVSTIGYSIFYTTDASLYTSNTNLS